ncbi:hypothetical protein [Thermoleptolyngbya sp.]
MTLSYGRDLRICDEFSGFRTISRGLHPREIVQLRKSSYGFEVGAIALPGFSLMPLVCRILRKHPSH